MIAFFCRIHYPLPLPYAGKPDPEVLQETIRRLQLEIKALKSQVHFIYYYVCLGLIKGYHFCNRSTILLGYWWYFGGCWWYIAAIMILVLQKYRKSHR